MLVPAAVICQSALKILIQNIVAKNYVGVGVFCVLNGNCNTQGRLTDLLNFGCFGKVTLVNKNSVLVAVFALSNGRDNSATNFVMHELSLNICSRYNNSHSNTPSF